MLFVMDSHTDPRFGAIKLLTDSQTTAGDTVTWVARFEPGRKGVASGGGIRLALCYRSSCGPVQCDKPDGEGYVTASGPEGVALTIAVDRVTHPWDMDLSVPYNFDMSSNVHVITVGVEGRALAEGDRIEVTIGDKSKGGPGFTAPHHSISHYTIWTMVDPDGGGSFQHFEKSPSLVLLSRAAGDLRLVLPSVVRPGESGDIRFAALDDAGSVAERFTGTAPVEVDGQGCHAPEDLRLSRLEKGTTVLERALSFTNEGFCRLRAADSSKDLAVKSNFCRCASTAANRIYWGDPHGHSVLSDGGERSADEYYQYARNASFLDFCALTDHDFGLAMKDSGRWDAAREAAESACEPGKFVTLLGWENTHIGLGLDHKKGQPVAPEKVRGHKNIYYRSGDGPLFNSSPYYGDLVERHFGSVEQLWALLGDRQAIAVPHHTSYVGGLGTNWDFHNPKFERLVEIYSKWGNSEYVGAPKNSRKQEAGRCVQDALARGYRLGFVAGSDTHDARPGYRGPETGLPFSSGLTAVLAPELTREAIWDALYARRCYATTGTRIYLDVTLNGHVMGSECRIEWPPKLAVEVGGTADVDKIEIIRDNKIIHAHKGAGDIETFEFEDKDAPRGAHYYYVRVTQSDEEIAWSSPIWVQPG